MGMPGFPPATPSPRSVLFSALVDNADRTREVPVVYAFGGQAPTTLPVGEAVQSSRIANATRVFVEFDPYSWMPDESP